MKKIIGIVLLYFLALPLFAFDFVDLDFSVSYQPVTFFTKINNEDTTDLSDFIERGQYMTYQSSLKFRQGLSLGFGIGFDSGYNKNNNFIGKVSDILANVGYKHFAIRVGRGNSLSIRKTTVDLVMDTYGIDKYTPAPWYMFVGINYTYLISPLPLTSIGGYNYNINAITELYGIILGSDTFSYFIHAPKVKKIEFYPWWDGFITFGIGTTKYQGIKEFSYDLRVSYNGGILIGGGTKLNWCLGLGYNVDGGLSLLHHGFVVRFGLKM